MKSMRTLAAAALSALLLSVLVACGGGPPATMASIPAYPDAVELQAGQNTLADTLSETMKSSVGGNLKSEVKLFEVPAEATWDQIKTFYTDSLAKTDWKATEELGTTSDAFSTVGWQRGSMASEQVLMVGYMPGLLGGAPVVIVSLFSE